MFMQIRHLQMREAQHFKILLRRNISPKHHLFQQFGEMWVFVEGKNVNDLLKFGTILWYSYKLGICKLGN